MNLQRCRTIAGNELRTQLRSPIPWALLLFVVILTMSVNTAPMLDRGGTNAGDARLFNNTPYTLAFVFGLLGFMVYGFFSSILAGMTVIRDDENKVSELLHSTPLTAGEYILGKYAGVLAALGLVLSVHVLLAMGYFELGPLDANLARGPFRPASYLVAALLFTVPSIGLFAGLAFAVGVWTRKPLVVFVVPTVLFVTILTLGLQSLLSTAESGADRILMVLEPSGLRWLFRTWFLVDRGVDFYNTAPLRPDATMLLSRLVALALPLIAVLASVPGLKVTSRAPRQGRPSDPAQQTQEKATWAKGLADLKMTSSVPAFLSSTIQMMRSELRELRGQPALYLFAPLVMGVVADVASSAEGPLGTAPILTAGGIAVGSLGPLTFLLCLVMLFYTVESVHRDLTTGFHSILYAAPFRTAALLLAKNLSNAVVAAVVIAGATMVCLGLLLIQSQGRLELWPFVLVWGLVLTPTFLLWSAFVTAVLAISRSRYLTYAVGLGTLLVTFMNLRREGMSWVLNWTLAGALRWSDMGPFALNSQALVLNRLLAVALAVFLMAVAVRAFARIDRDTTGVLPRLREWVQNGGALRLAPYAVVPLIVAGILAYQVRAGFQGGPASERVKDYRRLNADTWSEFQPARVTHVELDIDLEPAERRMSVVGTYVMANPSAQPMSSLPFTVGPAAGDVVWSLDGVPVVAEDRSGLHILKPSAALEPGDEIRVGFAYRAVHPRGITRNGGGIEQFILPSGVALHTLRDSFLPVPGFVEGIGVDPEERPGPNGGPAAPAAGALERFTTRVTVIAPSEYTVNSVGHKTAEEIRDGRTTVVWESGHPVGVINIVAGRWDVRRNGSTAVFYHPGHDYNVDEILATLVAARERYSEWFYPYPWKELKLSEFPDLVTNAQGFPTNIPFSEGIGFLTRSEPGKHLAFLVTAHEAAHQWWANVVTAAEGPGTDHLVEGMAHYSALLLHESELGLEGRIAFATEMESNYARWRRPDSELPLSRMVNDSTPADWTVVYEKGAWVQWMLQNHLGREQALEGTRRFIRRCVAENRKPVLEDMIDDLRPYAADAEAYDEFVDQWFFDVIVPEFRIDSASVVRSDDGWQVTAGIENVGAGTITVEIAASRGQRFTDDGEDEGAPYADQRTPVQLVPKTPRTVSWTVDFEPERLIVDPDALVLQLNRDQARLEL